MRRKIAVALALLMLLAGSGRIGARAEEAPSLSGLWDGLPGILGGGSEQDEAVQDADEAEEDPSDGDALAALGGEVTGDPDRPALTHPQERYEVLLEEGAGPDEILYAMLDAANDETADIQEYGALYALEHQELNDRGIAEERTENTFQDGPYGRLWIITYRSPWMWISVYVTDHYVFYYDGKTVETEPDPFDDETYNDPFESYHFPYGELSLLRGMRQDDNGYVYFLIESDPSTTFEFVVGTGMRIVQLRLYEEDESGEQRLSEYVDYDVGPAQEIPQVVLDAMDEALGSE